MRVAEIAIVPDLIVPSLSASTNTVTVSNTITLTAIVSNTGGGPSTAATLRWYRSIDSAITTADIPVGTSVISSLGAGNSVTISNTITVANSVGTNYYGACVDNLTGELQRANNCSSAVEIVVVAPTLNPDLIVINMMASRTNVDFSEEITLRATVRNAGASSSAATTLRWYRSTDSTITTADTPVGTSRLSSLGAGTSLTISNTITVPNSVGTYYYGACVDIVVDETEANNNCSSTVRVVVTDPSMHLPTSDFNTLNAAGNNVPSRYLVRWHHLMDRGLE